MMVVAIPANADPVPAPTRYLAAFPHYSDLGYQLPPPPAKGSQEDGNDLKAVEAKAINADPGARADAFADAEAFTFDVLLPRFSVSAGRTLTIKRRPILAHMLEWTLADTGRYTDARYEDIKAIHSRLRPFTQNPAIDPCDKSFLTVSLGPPPIYTLSYPSGHSTNGYIAALLLAKVMPDRAADLMARGKHYGDNRVVCGVHYPTDVAAGQAFAQFLFDKMSILPAFNVDLACAMEEDKADLLGALPNRKTGALKVGFSAVCQQKDEQYFAEMSAIS